MDRGHSPAGPQAPCFGHGAEPASGFEAHAAHDSVPDVLPMLEDERGMVGPGQTYHLPTFWPHSVVPAFGGLLFSQGIRGYMTRIKAQENIQQAQNGGERKGPSMKQLLYKINSMGNRRKVRNCSRQRRLERCDNDMQV